MFCITVHALQRAGKVCGIGMQKVSGINLSPFFQREAWRVPEKLGKAAAVRTSQVADKLKQLALYA